MCGLWGWQWKPNSLPGRKQIARLSKELAGANDSRGGQSWGAWHDGAVSRGLGPAQPHSQVMVTARSVMAHSRWATHGTNKLENTHPFVGGGLILSHNGVLSNHAALNSRLNRTHEVDSMHLLSHMVANLPFTEIEGYGAITWLAEAAPDAIYMGRLSERGEFSAARTPFGIVWSSSRNALKQALKSANIRDESYYTIEVGKAYYTHQGVMYWDDQHPSIAISQPVVTQHFSSYSTGTSSQYWCNKHVRNYRSCPCKLQDVWVLYISDESLAKIKEGEKHIPDHAKNDPAKRYELVGQVTEPRTAPNGAVGLPFVAPPEPRNEVVDARRYWCNKHRELALRCPCPSLGLNGGMHYLMTQGQAEYMQSGWGIEQEGSTIAMGPGVALKWKQPQHTSMGFCMFGQCVKNKQASSNFCVDHQKLLQDRDEERKAEWDAFYAKQEAEELEKEKAGLVRMLLHEAAELWLEDTQQITKAATSGMTPEQILEMAVEMGFDQEKALQELTADVEEMLDGSESDGETEVAVSESRAGAKPSNGRAAEAVAGSAKA